MTVAPVRLSASIGELSERALALIHPGQRAILGITGAPGAGKSTVAAQLTELLGARSALAPLDGFHLANEILISRGLQSRKGAPETFDGYGFLAMLARLRDRSDPVVYAPKFDRRLEEAIGSALPIAAGIPLVIVEGNYLLLKQQPWASVRRYLDACWYIDIPDATRVGRLITRHESYGRSEVEANSWVHNNDEKNAALIRNSRDQADLVIQGPVKVMGG